MTLYNLGLVKALHLVSVEYYNLSCTKLNIDNS